MSLSWVRLLLLFVMQNIKVKISKFFTGFLLVIYGGAFFILGQSILPNPYNWMAMLGCLFNFIYVLAHYHQFYLLNAVTEIWQTQEGLWLLLLSNGRLQQAQLLGNSYISSYLMILNFRMLMTKKTLSVILVADSYDKNEFRRLRVGLHNIANSTL